ncbi:MAG: serine hydrolase domain-containing protein [Ilumatobacteraceae bacterium]
MTVSGTCAPQFQELHDLLDASIDAGEDLGASIALIHDGEMVVDIWGGWADPERTRPWERDTIVNVWSTTKTVTSLAALILIDRGLLDVDAPVAKYWPEFAANGKENVLVRHVMSHTSGVAGWEAPVTVEDLYDPIAAARRLESQAPWWEPGTAIGYHGISVGTLVAELIRRIDGRSLHAFVAEEIAGPLGADFHIGLDPVHDSRVATIVPPPAAEIDLDALDKDSALYKFMVGPTMDPSRANDPNWRRAQFGAANGHGNARSVARVQSVVSHGGEIDGVRLLSPATCELTLREQLTGVDIFLGFPVRWGIGYALAADGTFCFGAPPGRMCCWGGWGGSVLLNDLDHGFTFAYMMNKMAPEIAGSARSEALVHAVYRAMK